MLRSSRTLPGKLYSIHARSALSSSWIGAAPLCAGVERGEVLQQAALVLAQVAQRRHGHGEHAQPVVEVGPEAAGPDLLLEVAVGGGQHPRLAQARGGLAHALELAVFQHAQELGLQLQRQLADLVEEQGAVARILEVAGAVGVGAGERALGVAEQRGLHQVRGDGGAVEREIGLGRARALAVQGCRHQFLAAPRFAFDQDRERRAGVLADLLAQLG